MTEFQKLRNTEVQLPVEVHLFIQGVSILQLFVSVLFLRLLPPWPFFCLLDKGNGLLGRHGSRRRRADSLRSLRTQGRQLFRRFIWLPVWIGPGQGISFDTDFSPSGIFQMDLIPA